MMITAKEAKIMREEAVEAEIREREARALKFCDEISLVIVNRAKQKLSHLTSDIEQEISAYVIKELQNNGYKVTKGTDNTITIHW